MKRLSVPLALVLVTAIMPLAYASDRARAHASVLQWSRAAHVAGLDESSPEEALRTFYHWYVHGLNSNLDPLGKQKPLLRKYITRRLYLYLVNLDKRGEMDYDYFLNAQDWDHAWENNIAVSKPSIQAGRATAVVSLTGPEMSVKLRVTLQQEDGGWKIDRVSTREAK